jgi:integrase
MLGVIPIRYIQKFLGHASLETTAIYTEMSNRCVRPSLPVTRRKRAGTSAACESRLFL